jgi:hypothetical protein
VSRGRLTQCGSAPPRTASEGVPLVVAAALGLLLVSSISAAKSGSAAARDYKMRPAPRCGAGLDQAVTRSVVTASLARPQDDVGLRTMFLSVRTERTVRSSVTSTHRAPRYRWSA